MDKKKYEELDVEILYFDESIYAADFNSVGEDEDELPGVGEDIFG